MSLLTTISDLLVKDSSFQTWISNGDKQQKNMSVQCCCCLILQTRGVRSGEVRRVFHAERVWLEVPAHVFQPALPAASGRSAFASLSFFFFSSCFHFSSLCTQRLQVSTRTGRDFVCAAVSLHQPELGGVCVCACAYVCVCVSWFACNTQKCQYQCPGLCVQLFLSIIQNWLMFCLQSFLPEISRTRILCVQLFSCTTQNWE